MRRYKKDLPSDLQKTGGLILFQEHFALIIKCEDGPPGTRKLVLQTGRDGIGQVTITEDDPRLSRIRPATLAAIPRPRNG